MRSILLLTGLTVALSFGALSFVRPPVLKDSAGTHWVSFEVSESTNVEVSLVDTFHQVTVRRLAAGVLGGNAPVPFAKGSLAQCIEWDGRDDRNQLVTHPESLNVRVRAGMFPKFDRMAERVTDGGKSRLGNRYFFNSHPYDNGAFYGLSLDSNGVLYALGLGGTELYNGPAPLVLRAYDGVTGAYLKTIFPFPADMDRNMLVPYGIILLDNNRYNIKTTHTIWPSFSCGNLGMFGVLFPEIRRNKIVAVNYDREGMVLGSSLKFNTFTEITPQSEALSAGALIRSPALPARTGGPVFFCYFPDGKSVLMSGMYGFSVNLPDSTGFWRDGQIYRINLATGAATVWLAFNADSLPRNRTAYHYMGYDAAMHGVAADDSGHVFVCDRMHGQIGVYDTAGRFIKAIARTSPDNIAVNKKTGELYVTVRGPGVTQVVKYSDWRGAPAAVASQPFSAVTKSHLVVNQTGSKPVLWVAAGGVCQGFRDDGSQLSLIGHFKDSVPAYCYLDKIAVDRKKDVVYVNDGWTNPYKIEDWSNPVLVRCSTSTKQRLVASDMVIGSNGLLYVNTITTILRYTTDHLHAPAPFGTRGTNIMASGFYNEWGAGQKSDGFGLAPGDDSLALVSQGGDALHFGCELWDTNGVKLNPNLIPMTYVGEAIGGVKYDRQGMLYMGSKHPLSVRAAPPAGYQGDAMYNYAVGSVLKFDPAKPATLSNAQVTGALKIYKTSGYGPFSGGDGSCACRGPRFDLDGYGRLFIPNGITGKVTVVDNEDNLIMQFGEYGNVDSRGEGSASPVPAIPLLYPVGAAATDDFIYVCDQVNLRILRIKMGFALDNLPGYSPLAAMTPAGAIEDKPSLLAYPNPFNPAVTVEFRGSSPREPWTAGIYDAAGREVAHFSSDNQKAGEFSWDAGDRPNGVYFLKWSAGNVRMTRRLIFIK